MGPELFISSMYGSSKKFGYDKQQKKLHDKIVKNMVNKTNINKKKKKDVFTVKQLQEID